MALFNPSASPAVVVREVDLTSGVPNVSSTTGVYVGNFNWGPVEQRVLVTSENDLASKFTSPKGATISVVKDFISATSFLTYSQGLYVTRMVDGAATNAYPEHEQVEQSYTVTDPDGDAQFTVINNQASTEYDVSLVDGGSGYNQGDVITILGSSLGGEDVTNNLVITVSTVNVDAVDTFTFTGTSTDTSYVVKNEDDFEFQTLTGVTFLAKYPGILGNSLKIEVCRNATTFDNDSWKEYANYFDTAPDVDNNEVHVVVVDEDGEFTGTPGTVLETYASVSTDPNAVIGQGTSNYILNVINKKSNYVWMVQDLPETATNPDATTGADVFVFASGEKSGELGLSEYINGFDIYDDPDIVTVDFLIAPSLSTGPHRDVIEHMREIAEKTRTDCVVIASPSVDAMNHFKANDIVKDIIAEAKSITASSYLVLDGNFLKVYDKYNDKYINIPAAASTAGLMASTDLNEAPWFSPAGTRRGRYFGVTSLAYNPNKELRDELYKASVNPITNIPGQGIVLYGDKTKLGRPSAFDRINVRRLFLVLERAIGRAAKNVIFELNDEFTRAEFTNIVEPVLRDVQGRRGITDFRVVCDETNNTPAVIDRNEFIANVFIKPTRSINYITLNFVAVRTGVSFEEVVGAV